MEGVNLLSVLMASAIAVVFGFIWYSPIMFGNSWMKMLKLDKLSKKEMAKDMPLTFSFMIFNTVTVAYVLNIVLQAFGFIDVVSAYFLTMLLWGTLAGGVTVSDGLFAMRRKKVILIDVGYRLLMLLIMTTTFLLLGF